MSGTGIVAEGVEFTGGYIALTWLSKLHSIGIFDNLKVLEQIHGHEGRTVVKWIDDKDE